MERIRRLCLVTGVHSHDYGDGRKNRIHRLFHVHCWATHIDLSVF